MKAASDIAKESVSRVIVVLVNLCREEDTAACIRSLQASECTALEIVLVDNGSPDGSGARLRAAFPEVIHLALPENTGFTGGNNCGIRFALDRGCDYVLLLNNDTVVEPACVSRLVEAMRTNPGAGAVGGKILFHDAPDRIWFAGGDFSPLRAAGLHRFEGAADPDPTGGSVEEVSFLTGCCMLIPAAVLREVGAFQEDLFAYVEDLELSLRLRAAGYRLLYVPAARLLHRVPLDPQPPTPFKIRLRDRNRRRVVRRHYPLAARLRFACFFYPTRLLLGARYALRGDHERAVAIFEGMIRL
jgi:GT2 family glycosyltransferase